MTGFLIRIGVLPSIREVKTDTPWWDEDNNYQPLCWPLRERHAVSQAHVVGVIPRREKGRVSSKHVCGGGLQYGVQTSLKTHRDEARKRILG